MTELGKLALIAGELAVLFLLMRALRIESPAFYERVAPMALAGALVNHLLPMRLRLGFFALLSMAAIWLVFGLVQGTWLVGIGMTLIALCHLPIPFAVRVGLLLTTAGVFAAMRAGRLPTPFSGAVWAILGSMFMFRLIVYVYEIRHLKERTTWEQRFAYFFCLPNVAFPLFPVLDFAAFRRTYYDRAPAEIYQQGVTWIVRGMLHLVAYRLVYQYVTLSPSEVHTGADLAQYAIANYGLYLRVSGQFHLIVGLLHLFGFRLPETHRFFYLASSFSDLWRRINIYWKDFMQKVFYLPLFFRLKRKRGETTAMVVSTALVFVTTWFFHSYQWFWLLGTWLWSATDTLFWALLGVCLIVNTLLEARRGRTRSVGARTPGAGQLLRYGLQTALMFSVMSLLWTLWSSPTLGGFVTLLRGVTFGSRDVLVIAGCFGGVALAAALGHRRAHTAPGTTGASYWPVMAGMIGLIGVGLGAVPSVEARMLPAVREVLASARELQLNKRDQEELQRGYYEQIVGVNRFNGELWNVYSRSETRWDRLRDLGGVRDVTDARLEELVGPKTYVLNGTRLTVNSAGLRDREYTRVKGDGVFRIAVLGQSYVMGSGVDDHETFENILEDQLNAGRAAGATRIELINFGSPAYSALQQLALLELGKVAEFAPDLVLVVGHRTEVRLISDYAQKLLARSDLGPLPPPIARLVSEAGVTAATDREMAQRLLQPRSGEALVWIYGEMVSRIRAIGALSVFAYIPTPTEKRDKHADTLLASAMASGFDALLDLGDVYRGSKDEDLIVASWDRHPNAKGHRLIAERLHRAFIERPELLRPLESP
jgi:D-alanyl-lipoteichoic acid acyltransferase DltB (MBOAT superfamily)